MPRPRPTAEYNQVRELLDRGVSCRDVAERTGVPYHTVRGWRRRSSPPRPNAPRHAEPPEDWRPPDARAYCYLLGLYLGDGCISGGPPRGSPWLAISMAVRYPAIIEGAVDAIATTVPDVRVRQHSNRLEGIVVAATHPVWPIAFPQHGPGRKHTRKIELMDWQLELTRRHPKALLRGLYHSDGCRSINRFDVSLPSGRIGHYEYVRYFSTNYSADIRRIFCDHCDLLDVRWTQSSFKNISVAHRHSVAVLESFLGPKR